MLCTRELVIKMAKNVFFSSSSSSTKVQSLYNICKMTFKPSQISPSPQAIQKISSLLDAIGPTDVGLKDETRDDDRGHGFFDLIFNRVGRWAPPITYIDLHECDSFTMCMFSFPTSAVIPLHDHPGMTVLSKVLYGSLHVKAYDWVEPAVRRSMGPNYPQVRLAKLAVDKTLIAPCETSVLYPKKGGNLHCFTAITPSAILDVLAPPYHEDTGRKCTYYRDYPYSTFSDNNLNDGNKEDYVWLAETGQPGGLVMRSGVYEGPSISV